MGCVVSSLHDLPYYISNDDFFFRKITKLKRILGNKKTVKRKVLFQNDTISNNTRKSQNHNWKTGQDSHPYGKNCQISSAFQAPYWLGKTVFYQQFLWEFFGNSLGILWEYFRNTSGILLEFYGSSLGNFWGIFWEFFGNSTGFLGEFFVNSLLILWGIFWISLGYPAFARGFLLLLVKTEIILQDNPDSKFVNLR